MSLGWPVTIGVHPGWTGNPAESWLGRSQLAEFEKEGKSCYNNVFGIIHLAYDL